MPTSTTLARLIKQHFGGTLAAGTIGDIEIVVTNDPDYEAKRWTITATGASKRYQYPLFGNDALSLTDISVSLSFDRDKGASGTVNADIILGGVDFAVQITLSNGTEQFTISSQMTEPVELGKVVSKIGGRSVTMPSAMKGTAIDVFGMGITHDDKAGWTVCANGRLQQPDVLPFKSGTTQLNLNVVFSGKKRVKLTTLGLVGETKLSKTGVLSLGYAFSSKISALAGILQTDAGKPITFEDLSSAVGVRKGRSRKAVHTPRGLDLAAGELVVDFENESLLLSGRNSLGEDGFLFVGLEAEARVMALGVATEPGWHFGDAAKEFAVIDDVLTVKQGYLAVTNRDVSITSTVFPKLGEHDFHLTAGLNIGAELAMDQSQSSTVGKALVGLLSGTPSLLLQAALGPNPKDTTFTAGLGNLDLNLQGPDPQTVVLHIKSARINVTLEPSVSLSGAVAFPTPARGRIDLNGFVTLKATPGGPVIAFGGHALDQEAAMPPPENATGLKLTGIGGTFTLAPEALVVELDGTMWIGRDKAQFAFGVTLPELEPTLLEAHYSRLDLTSMFRALCPHATLPKALSGGISFQNLSVWSCSDPSGTCVLSDGSPRDRGFAFNGDASVFNFPAHADLSMTTKGMSGKISMRKAVSVPKVFTISDATDHSKGPHFAFQTEKSPYLDAAFYVDVLGFKDSTTLQLSDKGFLLKAHFSFKGKSIDLACVLAATANRHLSAAISGKGKFRASPLDLGSGIKLSDLSVSLSSKTMSFSVKAKAKIYGVSKTAIVVITLAQIEHKLVQLGHEIETELRKISSWL